MSGGFLIVRLGSLGDLIHTLPAVAALRRAHPDAPIDWLVEPEHRELLDLVPILSNVIVMKGRSLSGWWATSRELRARRYEAALDFQGLIKSAALARLSGARRVVGFDGVALREPAARHFYTTIATVGEGRHVIQKNLALVDAVLGRTGASSSVAAPLEFPIRDIVSPAVHTVRQQVSGRFALVNPGAAWPNKRWPADRFGVIASMLRRDCDLVPVVLWGPGERALAESVVAASGGAAVVAPETQLPDLVALSREASFMISGDTGPLHIACAAGTPSVALFGPTDAKRNGPWNPRDVVLTRYESCPCHYKRQCLQPEKWCLADVAVDEVRTAVRTRLAGA